MQAALQRHIDQAISSTINLPKDTSLETVQNIYRIAWEQGLKGITVYREGSREGILLTEVQAKKQAEKIVPAQVTPRPVMLNGITTRERTPLGTAFITINYTNEKAKDPFEVFVRLGKAGSDLEADAEEPRQQPAPLLGVRDQPDPRRVVVERAREHVARLAEPRFVQAHHLHGARRLNGGVRPP